MRKKINFFLYKKWPWAYGKLRKARIWFYCFQEDFGRKYDAINEPAKFFGKHMDKTQTGGLNGWIDQVVDGAKKEYGVHDFHESEKVFH